MQNYKIVHNNVDVTKLEKCSAACSELIVLLRNVHCVSMTVFFQVKTHKQVFYISTKAPHVLFLPELKLFRFIVRFFSNRLLH